MSSSFERIRAGLLDAARIAKCEHLRARSARLWAGAPAWFCPDCQGRFNRDPSADSHPRPAG